MAFHPTSTVLLLLPGAGPPGRRGGVLEGRVAVVRFPAPALMREALILQNCGCEVARFTQPLSFTVIEDLDK